MAKPNKVEQMTSINDVIAKEEKVLEAYKAESLKAKKVHEDALVEYNGIAETIQAVSRKKNETLKAFEDAESKVGDAMSRIALLKGRLATLESAG